jgi:hemolysin activation/secretion protein
LLGLHERTEFRAIAATHFSELQYYEIEHQEILNSELTQIMLAGSYTRSEPGESLRSIEFKSESISLEADIKHPLIRSRLKNLWGRITYSHRNTDTDVLGVQFTKDRIRSLRLGFTYDFVDSFYGVNLLEIETSKGLKILDASASLSPILSRTDGETDYAKVTAEISRLQRLAPGWTVLASVAGQYTADGLVASEEFSIGGARFGRAFDPSEVSGDKGAAARVELRYHRAFNSRFLDQAQFYTFYDYGSVWNQNINNPGASRQEELSSTGAGIRASIVGSISANIEVAVPIIDNINTINSNRDDVRGLFEIAAHF